MFVFGVVGAGAVFVGLCMFCVVSFVFVVLGVGAGVGVGVFAVVGVVVADVGVGAFFLRRLCRGTIPSESNCTEPSAGTSLREDN